MYIEPMSETRIVTSKPNVTRRKRWMGPYPGTKVSRRLVMERPPRIELAVSAGVPLLSTVLFSTFFVTVSRSDARLNCCRPRELMVGDDRTDAKTDQQE